MNRKDQCTPTALNRKRKKPISGGGLKGMKILMLGGTRFLGRHLVEVASSRGHTITLFNRGQSNPQLFPEIEKLQGNRDGNLQALKNRQWDAVIDTSGFVSHNVRATAELFASSASHYIFISSCSVYADFSKPGLDETAAVATLPHGVVEDETNAETYGARKALCEKAAEQAMPGRVLNVRPGIIVGPHDETDRFTWWVRRIASGGETLAPDHPDKPVQLIDVRDLAGWIIQMVERNQVGVYNAKGPSHVLTFQQMLEACKIASGSNSHLTWIDAQFLLEQGVVSFSELPFWISEAEWSGFFSVNSRRAMNAGLACRPLVETVRDTLLWDHNRSLPNESSSNLVPPLRKGIGLDPERERELLRKWKGNQE
jgi:2'-hydroxyisoflavone reductase